MAIAVTGARGTLGRALLPLLHGRIVPIDRADGIEIEDAEAMRAALRGCDVVVHLAALHPLVAPAGADVETYRHANVAPFAALLDVARDAGVRRVVLASSTSVWSDETRLVDESVAPDATDGYAISKRDCEAMLRTSGLDGVTLRFARFAQAGDTADEVRKLYRAVDVRDAAAACVVAIDHARPGSVYAISGPTPFGASDVPLLATSPGDAIARRIGRPPPWVPSRVGAVVLSERASAELGWSCRYPSTLLDSRGGAG